MVSSGRDATNRVSSVTGSTRKTRLLLVERTETETLSQADLGGRPILSRCSLKGWDCSPAQQFPPPHCAPYPPPPPTPWTIVAGAGRVGRTKSSAPLSPLLS